MLTRHRYATYIIAVTLGVFVLCYSSVVRANSLTVDFNDDLVSIDAVDASLLNIAEQLTELTGISVSSVNGHDQIGTLKIVKEPLKAAVTKLVDNSVFVTKMIDGETRVIKIIFLLSGNETYSSSTNLPPGKPATSIISGKNHSQTIESGRVSPPEFFNREEIPIAIYPLAGEDTEPTKAEADEVDPAIYQATVNVDPNEAHPQAFINGETIPEEVLNGEMPAIATPLTNGENSQSLHPEAEVVLVVE